MSRERDKAALERELLQRKLDARALMRDPAFRRFAQWLTRPLRKLPRGATTEETQFMLGQWQSAKEISDLLRDANFDAWQRLEREARTDTVPRRGDSADS